MKSIKATFARVAVPYYGFDTFTLLLFAIAILDDAQTAQERRKKRNREAKSQHKPKDKPPAGPRPC